VFCNTKGLSGLEFKKELVERFAVSITSKLKEKVVEFNNLGKGIRQSMDHLDLYCDAGMKRFMHDISALALSDPVIEDSMEVSLRKRLVLARQAARSKKRKFDYVSSSKGLNQMFQQPVYCQLIQQAFSRQPLGQYS
ncbi:3486_t:CDS:2, partial [Cetraspora pellucida]